MTELELITGGAAADMSFTVAETPFDWSALHDQLYKAATNTWLNVYVAKPWKNLRCASDYYDMIRGTDNPLFPFEKVHQASALVREATVWLDRSSIIPSRSNLDSLLWNPDGKNTRFNLTQDYRDDVAESKNCREPVIPFTPHEIYLYKRISQGAEPWNFVQAFSADLIEAIRMNPQVACNLIQAMGLDLILPLFPAIDRSQLDTVHSLLDGWQTERSSTKNGITFFSEVLRQAGVSTQRENETNVDYMHRVFQLLPSLEPYVQYDLSPEEDQKPEYYMQLLLGTAYFALQRKVQFNEMQEAVSALTVMGGKIVGASHNIPTKYPNRFRHAEQVAIEGAVEKTGDPTLSGASLFVLVEPCVECIPLIRKHNFQAIYMGPRTRMGGDTKGKLLTRDVPSADCPSGDWLAEQGEPYFPIPEVIVFDILYDQIAELIVKGQGWEKFILPPT